MPHAISFLFNVFDSCMANLADQGSCAALALAGLLHAIGRQYNSLAVLQEAPLKASAWLAKLLEAAAAEKHGPVVPFSLLQEVLDEFFNMQRVVCFAYWP
jgi:hypothetical protein